MSDIDQIRAKFRKLAQLKIPQADLLKYAQIVRDERRRGFERSEAPDGSRWKPLKPATILRKSGKHSTSKIVRKKGISGLGKSKQRKASISPESPLIDFGYLMNPTVSADSRYGKVTLAKSRSAAVWQGKSISEIHDKGSGRIPQRHHWGIYKAAKDRIQQAFMAWLRAEVMREFS